MLTPLQHCALQRALEQRRTNWHLCRGSGADISATLVMHCKGTWAQNKSAVGGSGMLTPSATAHKERCNQRRTLASVSEDQDTDSSATRAQRALQ
jgi:hypothetical protein